MAKQKLNVKFLAIFLGIAAVLLAGAGAVAVAGGNLRVAFEK